MFFMMGIFPEEKQLDFTQTGICPACGRMGRYEVFRTCSCLSLFFIPVWRWGKQYRVRMNCCGAAYALSPEKGHAIEHDPSAATLTPDDLTPLSSPRNTTTRHCPACGFISYDPSFTYCPKCGRPMEP